ncbi:hypothetical protein BH09MYX1_BH09MYX1_27110 [soil metagenome]
MKTRAIAAALILSFAPIALTAPTVLAQAPQADDAATKAARVRFQEGVTMFDKGDFEGARASFKQALALKPHPAILLNLAQSSLKSNHPLEALKYFLQYKNEKDPAATDKPAADKGIADARAKLARIDVQGPNGTEITVDNERVGFLPMDPVDVEAGTHTLKTKTPDGVTNESKVTLAAGGSFSLRAGSAPPPTPPVDPIPTAPPPTGTVPPPNNPPPNGNPPPIDNPPSDTTNKPGPLSPPKTLWPVFVFGCVGVAGLIVGISFAVARSGAQDKADQTEATIKTAAAKTNPPTPTQGLCNAPPSGDFAKACTTLKDNQNAVDTDNAIAIVGVTVGIAGLVGMGLYYLLAAKKDPARAASMPVFSPWIAPHVGGGALSFSF